jgi:hypothetical protein
MSYSLTAGLYPVALAVTNFGISAGLYSVGALATAGLLFAVGLFVLVGAASAIRRPEPWPTGTP